MTRREMLFAPSVAAALASSRPPVPTKLGLAASHRWSGASGPLAFLDYCHRLGAAGIQASLENAGPADLKTLARRAGRYGMWIEAIIDLPVAPAALEAFERSVLAARSAGASLARAAMPSRRSQTSGAPESFRQFSERCRRSVALAEPVARRHKLPLAVENHANWRVPEMLDMLQWIGSEYVGVLLDPANSIALLENPSAVVEAYAPHTMAVAVQDVAAVEYPDGFLLFQVVLGDGCLNLPYILQRIRQARPAAHFSLHRITGEPVQVPCLTPRYWAAFDLPARELSAVLALVRAARPKKPLPRFAALAPAQQRAYEDRNVRACLDYARNVLRL